MPKATADQLIASARKGKGKLVLAAKLGMGYQGLAGLCGWTSANAFIERMQKDEPLAVAIARARAGGELGALKSAADGGKGVTAAQWRLTHIFGYKQTGSADTAKIEIIMPAPQKDAGSLEALLEKAAKASPQMLEAALEKARAKVQEDTEPQETP